MITDITVDPTRSFTEVEPEILLHACGILIPWAVNAEYFDRPVKEAYEVQYAFGSLGSIDGITIDNDGTYRYPGDPPNAPLVTILRGNEIIHIYQHAIVAIRNEKREWFCTRMD